MQAGTVPSRRIAASSLLLLMTMLICASCNLNIVPEDASAQFEGAPVIHIAAPQPGQTYLAGTTVIVQARVENAGPDLARVAVLLDESLLGEKLQPNETNAAVLPLTIDWPTSNTGQYTISVVAERADGSAAREEVSIEVISRQRPEATPPSDTATSAPQPTTAPSSTPDSPSSPEPTQTTEPAALGPSRVAGTVLAVANLRPGPGVDSGLPLGSLHADSAVMLVAVNPERDWYRVTTGDGGEGWIDARFVEAAETTAGLPVDSGETPAAGKGRQPNGRQYRSRAGHTGLRPSDDHPRYRPQQRHTRLADKTLGIRQGPPAQRPKCTGRNRRDDLLNAASRG